MKFVNPITGGTYYIREKSKDAGRKRKKTILERWREKKEGK